MMAFFENRTLLLLVAALSLLYMINLHSQNGNLRGLYRAHDEYNELCFLVRISENDISKLFTLFFTLLPVDLETNVQIKLIQTYDPNLAKKQSVTLLHHVVNTANSILNREVITIMGVNGSYTSTVYPELVNASRAGDAGYVITDLIIEGIIERRREVGKGHCALLAVSNGDNMYSQNFLPATTTAIRDGSDMVATHFVSRYNWIKHPVQHANSGPYRPGRDVEVKTRFYPGFVDLGCVIFKTELLEKSGFRFVLDSIKKNSDRMRDPEFPKEYYGIDFNLADGILFRKLAGLKNVNATIIPRALFIHQ